MSDMECVMEMEENNKWLQQNYEKFRERYGNKFIAIDRKEVVGIGDTPQGILNELKGKKINIKSVLIEFIPEKGLILIL